MKKQRIRPQDYPLLYDPHPLSQTNALTKSGLYTRYTWRQDLHLLHVPAVPIEVERVFSRNEETKKATDKLKLMKAIFADELGLNNKETHPIVTDSESKQKEKDAQEDSDMSIEETPGSSSAWRTQLPKQALRRIAARSRVPLHMMTSATLAPLPMEKPTLEKTKSSKFLEYATDPRFTDLVALVRRKNPNSALLGGTARLKKVAWADQSNPRFATNRP